jgi:DNA-binding CsgD family transcriptional regulator
VNAPPPAEARARRGGTAGTVPVALRVADPALAARLAALPGVAPVEDAAEAEAILADAADEEAEAPLLLFAEGGAALAGLRAGARAILSPDAEAHEIAAALAAVRAGLAVLPAALLDALRPEAPAEGAALSPRESEVLALLTDGASNKVIARRLGLSFHTAKAHVAAVLAKLGAASRAEAVAIGLRRGLVML